MKKISLITTILLSIQAQSADQTQLKRYNIESLRLAKYLLGSDSPRYDCRLLDAKLEAIFQTFHVGTITAWS